MCWTPGPPPALSRAYTRLHTLEFDSVRKRMSVIVRHPGGKIYLITKGAESSLVPRCVAGPSQQTEEHIDQCAALGLCHHHGVFIVLYLSHIYHHGVLSYIFLIQDSGHWRWV